MMAVSTARTPIPRMTRFALAVDKPRARRGRAPAMTGVVVAALLVSGCQIAPDPRAASDQETALFQQAYGDIARYYIEPVTPRALALAGLRKLSTIDTALAIEPAEDYVVLHYGRDATRFAAPVAQDAQGWGALSGEALAAARAASASLAALPSDRLDETVVDGSLAILDRFSHYAPPPVAQERRAARDGFGGIGVTLSSEREPGRITEVLPDTPAAAAGLLVDDRIIAIDGADTASLAREEVVPRLRGPTDSVVSLTVARSNAGDPFTVAMHRAFIVPPSVVLTQRHGTAQLRLTAFNQQTAQRVVELLQQAHRDMGSTLRGIILDLRGNPGGLLDQSIEVASAFLDGTTVASTVGRVSESVQTFTAPHREVERLPLVVLVNGGSASAAEIVAAALQDSARAVVIGSASYGKGTVQNVKPLPNEAELAVTWARLIAPSGYVLHEHGVVPTICTANLPDDSGGVAAALGRNSAALRQPRAELDEAGWQRLRQLCPGQHEDHGVEVRVAERLLAEPTLYARALRLAPAGGSAPITTAGVDR
jgi:carboxyl-terminal processing protease